MRKTRIICAGIFDQLTSGQLSYLKESKNIVSNAELIVIVARDTTAERIKHQKPMHDQETRLRRLKALEFVDDAVIGFEQDRIIDRIVSLQPDIILLGHDQLFNSEELKEQLSNQELNVKIVRMPKFE